MRKLVTLYTESALVLSFYIEKQADMRLLERLGIPKFVASKLGL